MEEQKKPSSRLKNGGRPKKDPQNKKSKWVTIKVTPLEKKRIQENAGKLSLTTSEYCLKLALHPVITTPFSEDELKLKRGLVGMANNLNQIAYQANAAGFESVQDTCKELLKEIKKELEKFRK